MSDRNFSRRRRGGMRFRPTGGLGHSPQKPDREATEARADATGAPGAHDKVYDRRHAQEIDRAENIAAGLPPEGPAYIPDLDRVNADDGVVFSVRTFDEDTSLTTTPGWDDVTGVGSPTPKYLDEIAWGW